jgi:hypothetical protein
MVQAIAKGDMTAFFHSEPGSPEEAGRTANELWDQLARLYLLDNPSSGSSAATCEAALYQQQSVVGDADGSTCRLVSIEQQADTSDYSNMAGGAMAVFQLS